MALKFEDGEESQVLGEIQLVLTSLFSNRARCTKDELAPISCWSFSDSPNCHTNQSRDLFPYLPQLVLDLLHSIYVERVALVLQVLNLKVTLTRHKLRLATKGFVDQVSRVEKEMVGDAPRGVIHSCSR